MKTIIVEFNVPDEQTPGDTAEILSSLASDFRYLGLYGRTSVGDAIHFRGKRIGEWAVSTEGACPGCYDEQVEAGNGEVEGVRFGALCEVHQGR